MANEDIKKMAIKKNVRLWKIADRLGITDSTFSKKLRKEIPESEKRKIFHIIDQLTTERKE